MTDIEKAIKGLEEISDYFDIYRNEKNDYYSPAQDYYNAAENAIALLKQQEAAYQGAEELLRQKTILFDDAIKRLKEQNVDTSKYQYKYDHTDCIWYHDGKGRCPVTCSQYRDGWNDAMNFIFKNGAGYRPYKRR